MLSTMQIERKKRRRAYGKYAYIHCLFSSSCRCSACFDTDKGLCIYLILFFYHHFHVNLPWGVVPPHEVQLFIICFSVASVVVSLINCAAAKRVFHNSNKLLRSRPIFICIYVCISELYKRIIIIKEKQLCLNCKFHGIWSNYFLELLPNTTSVY